jgi:tRNA pseudouridine38-40 synthase
MELERDPPQGVLVTVAYDGAGFVGYAPQRDGRTVHGALLAAAQALDPSVAVLRGASRTDAGVHARGQQVAFDPARHIPPRGWVLGMNAHLPVDVAVRRARQVPRGFEPRASGVGKRYRYVVLQDPVRDPLLDRQAWRVDGPLDLAAARAELGDLLGAHDFRGFRSSRDERIDTVRTITRAELLERVHGDPRLLAIEIEGTAFLHNMVRIVVGTVIDVARGHLGRGAIARGLASGRRDDLGMTAPAHALFLEHVGLAVTEGASWP